MRRFATALLLLCLSGCLIPLDSVKLPSAPTNVTAPSDPDGIIPKVRDSIKGSSKDDILRAYKIINGFSLYVKNYGDLPNTTDKLFAKFGQVEDGYGFKTSASALNAVIEADLKSKGLDDPKPTADVKAQLVERFTLYSAGLESAYSAAK